MIGHITYLSDDSMLSKFGRNLQDREKVGYDLSADFQVESDLDHQGQFHKTVRPNTYLYITKAIDYFDLTNNGSLISGLSGKGQGPGDRNNIGLVVPPLSISGDRVRSFC